LSHTAFFALLQVILIDVVLAGDNAVVIGMAAARIPPAQRGKVIFWGLSAAVVLRILLALVTVALLAVPGLMLIGGLLLLWVCWRLYRDLENDRHTARADTNPAKTVDESLQRPRLPASARTMRRAALRIVAADISMSLDNVLAVAGAALRHPGVLVLGLLLSVALVGLAANLVARLIARYCWIGYAGLLIVLFVALRMILAGALEAWDKVPDEWFAQARETVNAPAPARAT
jgi:YjbE family integral membrane protein